MKTIAQLTLQKFIYNNKKKYIKESMVLIAKEEIQTRTKNSHLW